MVTIIFGLQVINILGRNSDSPSAEYCSGEESTVSDANIKPEVHKLIHDLVVWIHGNESDIEKSILVFLPTYRSLVQQWFLLKPLSSLFNIHILHSSIDTDQALKAMKISQSRRKVYFSVQTVHFTCVYLVITPCYFVLEIM